MKRFRATDAVRRPGFDIEPDVEPPRPSAGEALAKVVGIGRRRGDVSFVKKR